MFLRAHTLTSILMFLWKLSFGFTTPKTVSQHQTNKDSLFQLKVVDLHIHSARGWEKKSTHIKTQLNTYNMSAQSLQLCPTLHDPMDHSLPDSSVHGILQGKNTGVGCHALLQGIFLTQVLNPWHLLRCRQILYCWKWKWKSFSHVQLFAKP